LWAAAAWVQAGGAAVIVSKDNAVYRAAAQTLAGCLPGASIHVLPESDAEADSILREVGAFEPRLLVAVGARALAECGGSFPGAPTVYLMVVSPEKQSLGPNAYGVAWLPHPKILADRIRLLCPGARRVGMLSIQPEIRLGEVAAGFEEAGLRLEVGRIGSVADVPDALRKLGPEIDALWMGVEEGLTNQEAFSLLKSYALQRKIPLFVPIDALARNGALASISISPRTAAAQACQVAGLLLRGEKPRDRLFHSPDVAVDWNEGVASAIGRSLPAEARALVREILK